MRHLLRAILLVSVLCMAGCKEEEPQSVAFSIHEKTLGDKGEGFYVNIDANCSWTISCDCGYNLANKESGEGPSDIFVYLFSNENYKENIYRITITSEDGTSSDVLTVTQGEKIDFIPDPSDLIHEEGGEFHITAKTNDEITSITTPEWITWNSSRALSEHTYSFTVEPNKTGTKRDGHIRFIGKRTDQNVTVTQNSFMPTGVKILSTPIYALTGEAVSLDIALEPEYADDSELYIKILHDGREIKSTYSNHQLQFTASYAGEYTLEFYGNDTLIQTETIEAFDKEFMGLNCEESCLVGDIIDINVSIPMNICSIEIVGGKNILEKVSETKYVVTGEGSFTFIGTNTLTGNKNKKTVNSSLAMSNSWTSYGETLSDGKRLVTFYTELVSNSKMGYIDYRVFGPDGYLVLEKNVFITYNWTSILFKSFEIPAEKGKHTIWITVSINGETKHEVSNVFVQ